MKKNFLSLLLSIVGSVPLFSQIVVDDFNTGPFTLNGPTGYRDNITATGAIGGYRNAIVLGRNGLANLPSLMSLNTSDGFLNINVGDNNDYTYASWGKTTFNPPNPTSLGLNVSAYSAIAIKLLQAPTNLGGRVRIVLYKNNGESFDAYNFSEILSGPKEYIFALANFRKINLSSPDLDLTQIDGIELFFNGGVPPSNIKVDYVEFKNAPIPPIAIGSVSPTTVNAGESALFTVAVTPGSNPISTGLGVTGNFTGIGGSATQTFYDNGTNGDVTAGDNIFSYLYLVPASVPANFYSVPVTASDAQSRSVSDLIDLTINAKVASATTTSIVSTTNPTCAGSEATFKASVSSGGNAVTSGTVTFTEGATILATNVAFAPDQFAWFSTASLSVGQHTITATYNGTVDFASSNSSVVQTVSAPTTWYRDADNDGFGDASITRSSCTKPEGYVSNGRDCNDAIGAINPGATEICGNGIDDNCNGQVDENCEVLNCPGIVLNIPRRDIIWETIGGVTNGVIYASLNKPSCKTVTVDWKLANGTFNNPYNNAIVGLDFNAGQGTLTFAPGETQKTIPIQVLHDRLFEDFEFVNVEFTNATNAFSENGNALIGSTDNYPCIDFTMLPVLEGNSGNAVFNMKIKLNRPYPEAVSVPFSTLDNAAKAGLDYVATSGTISFAAEQTETTIPIQIIGDLVPEMYEGFFLEFGQPNKIGCLRSGDLLAQFITDNDPVFVSNGQPALKLSSASALVENKVRVNAWPNPVSSILQVNIDAVSNEKVSLQLVNSQGQILKQIEAAQYNNKATINIPVADLPQGNYRLLIKSKSVNMSKPIVIVK